MENNLNNRKIAIFTDAHALLEPTQAALEDMHRRGITEIYSLGDNIGVGPNPSEVIDLLEDYGVKSLAGNSEEYTTLGIDPFRVYFNSSKTQSQLWTLSKLNEYQKKTIAMWPHSIELLIGGKKLALCHFANDVRFDYRLNSTWSYQDKINNHQAGYKQFLYTNSDEQLDYMHKMIEKYGKDKPFMRGFVSALDEPLFASKRVDFFDAIIQGHVHWKIYESSPSTDFYSIRAVGMAYAKDPIDTASYVILSEKTNGYDLEEVLVKYDREKMKYSILNSDMPDQTIQRFVNLSSSENSDLGKQLVLSKKPLPLFR